MQKLSTAPFRAVKKTERKVGKGKGKETRPGSCKNPLRPRACAHAHEAKSKVEVEQWKSKSCALCAYKMGLSAVRLRLRPSPKPIRKEQPRWQKGRRQSRCRSTNGSRPDARCSDPESAQASIKGGSVVQQGRLEVPTIAARSPDNSGSTAQQ